MGLIASLAYDIKAASCFVPGLPRFLHRRITADQARAIQQARIRRREDAFLSLAERSVFRNPRSPYLSLFRAAGCESGDLERLVRSEGLESALAKLLAQGVYLTVDEFKGRREARRGLLSVPCGPNLLRNPGSTAHLFARTSGSRGSGTPVMIDFGHIADCAVSACRLFEAHGGMDWIKADWEVPGGGAMFRLLKLSRFGRPMDRWFSHVDPASPEIHPRYRWSARILRWESLLAAAPLPPVEYVPPDRPAPVVRWMKGVLDAGRTPLLFTFPSSAVRVCLAASELGLSLEGARFLIGGEPITEARLSTIHSSGARAIPRYGSIELGPVSYGCLNPLHPDETHVNLDLQAVIQAGPEGPPAGLPPASIFLTGLRPRTPYVAINLNLGDQAVLERRRCGCPLEAAGLDIHLHTIRSFEKLTGAGMTFMDTDIVRILDEDLPARFGGGPTDYQLIEEEDERGRSVLKLVIHPRLGPIEPAAASGFFLECVSRGSGVERVMGLNWKHMGLIEIERLPPQQGATGKIQHLLLQRKA